MRRAFQALAALALAAAGARSAPARAAESAAAPREGRLYVVGTSHLDTQWNWTVRETIRDHLPATARANFEAFERHPGYVLSFDGAFRYGLLREYWPEEYARLQAYAAQGRWAPAGGFVDACDVNGPSPESLVRQVLYGNGFFRRELGLVCRDVFLPDCFGFGFALPSVAAHCGLKGFSTSKLTWGACGPLPFELGRWLGPDGRGVVAALAPGPYDVRLRRDLSTSEPWRERLRALRERSGVAVQYTYLGVGDTGGAPDDGSLACLELSLHGTGPVQVVSAPSDRMFLELSDAETARLPAFSGELLLQAHGAGSYTAGAALKRWNRRNERLADAVERAAVVADWLGAAPYPETVLRECWWQFLWHQFHDDLTGTSIPEVYAISWNDEAVVENRLRSELAHALQAVSRGLDTRAEGGVPVVVFNPLSFGRQDTVEAAVRFKGPRPAAIRVFEADGVEVPSQPAYGEGDQVGVRFVADVPAVGLRVYHVRPAAELCRLATGLAADAGGVENERYRVRLDAQGDVASVFDKALGRELLGGPVRLQALPDTSVRWPAWELQREDVAAAPWACVGAPVEARVVERGPARVAVEVRRRLKDSVIVQRIRLAAGGAGDRVEWETTLDWRTPGTLLKAAFPLAPDNPEATYDLGLGVIRRGTNVATRYEVPAQEWAHVADPAGAYGVAVLSDGKYGWDRPDSRTLRLTLVHTPWTGPRYAHQARLDAGRQELAWAVAAHGGAWQTGGVAEQAARLNQPLLAVQVEPHGGALGTTFAFLRVAGEGKAVRALKRAEESAEVVVRLQETRGEAATNLAVEFVAPILAAREVNGAEEPLGAARLEGGRLAVSLDPWQPRAFAVTFAPPARPLAPPAAAPVPLPFNLDGVSADSDRRDGDFDGAGHTLPAELFPETATAAGVAFHLGPAGPGRSNVVVCAGQRVALPSLGGAGRLYLLAVAVGGDITGRFEVDGEAHELRVQDYAEDVGGWDTLLQPDGLFCSDLRRVRAGRVRPAPIAWLTTHRHSATEGNEPYRFAYAFRYSLPLPAGARELTLPRESRIRVLAATVVQGAGEEPALFCPPVAGVLAAPRVEPWGGPILEPVAVRVTGRPGEALHYTLDGSAPTLASPRYRGPLRVAETGVLRVRAYDAAGQEGRETEARFVRTALRRADRPRQLESGLVCTVRELTTGATARVSRVESVALPEKAGPTGTAARFEGFVRVPADGFYTFHLLADGGGRVLVGDRPVAVNDGSRPGVEQAGTAALQAGLHAFAVECTIRAGADGFNLEYDGPVLGRQPMPADVFWRARQRD
jgi:alpha-mannosidase